MATNAGKELREKDDSGITGQLYLLDCPTLILIQPFLEYRQFFECALYLFGDADTWIQKALFVVIFRELSYIPKTIELISGY